MNPARQITQLLIQTDGGARGNPGPAGIGMVAIDQDTQRVVGELSHYIGEKTNNEAEYEAFLASAEWLHTANNVAAEAQVVWQLDSKLVVEQLNKKWKIKQPHLQVLAKKAWSLLQNLPYTITIEHIRREHNSAADALVNQALDAAT